MHGIEIQTSNNLNWTDIAKTWLKLPIYISVNYLPVETACKSTQLSLCPTWPKKSELLSQQNLNILNHRNNYPPVKIC